MALVFPSSPSVGDEFTGGGFTWTWNGTSWSKISASGGSQTDQWVVIESLIAKRVPITTGLYSISAYKASPTNPASTVVWKIFAANQTTQVSSGTLVDQDSGNDVGPYGFTFYQDGDGYLEVSDPSYSESVYVKIETLAYTDGLNPNLTTYNTSQSFVVPDDASAMLIVGGGGGGGGAGSYGQQAGSSGGGSGYINLRTSGFSPGQTLSLTVGAGGLGGDPASNGSSGGTTTVAGIGSASGGQFGAYKGTGGSGGSGGGGTKQGGAAGGGAAGGSNGSAGSNGASYTGGAGSSVTLPSWVLPGSGGGAGGVAGGGGGGGLYAGGGGGGAANYTYSSGGGGQAATGLGGGGGGGGGGFQGSSALGGNGADGGVIILAGWA